jgi:hypothetical protein
MTWNPTPEEDFVVDVHGEIDAEFIARMTTHLRDATSWWVNEKSSIPVLRCTNEDDETYMYVMDRLIMPPGLQRRANAPQAFADRVRGMALDALARPASTDEAVDRERERLRMFARIAHHVTDAVPDVVAECTAGTPWAPPQCQNRGIPRAGMTDELLALAPRLYEIGASGDSSMRRTSIGLFAASGTSLAGDPMEALRAMDALRSL